MSTCARMSVSWTLWQIIFTASKRYSSSSSASLLPIPLTERCPFWKQTCLAFCPRCHYVFSAFSVPPHTSPFSLPCSSVLSGIYGISQIWPSRRIENIEEPRCITGYQQLTWVWISKVQTPQWAPSLWRSPTRSETQTDLTALFSFESIPSPKIQFSATFILWYVSRFSNIRDTQLKEKKSDSFVDCCFVHVPLRISLKILMIPWITV